MQTLMRVLSAPSLIRQTCFISTQIQHKQSYLFCPNVHHITMCLVLPLLSAILTFCSCNERNQHVHTSSKRPGNVMFVFQAFQTPYLRFTTVDTKPWSSNRDQGSVERARQRSRGICRMTDMSVQFIEQNLTRQNQLCFRHVILCSLLRRFQERIATHIH